MTGPMATSLVSWPVWSTPSSTEPRDRTRTGSPRRARHPGGVARDSRLRAAGDCGAPGRHARRARAAHPRTTAARHTHAGLAAARRDLLGPRAALSAAGREALHAHGRTAGVQPRRGAA